MPRYLIERIFEDPDPDEDKLRDFGETAKRLTAEQFRDIVWEHSHVVVDNDGRIKSFCVYTAPEPQRLKDHADALGFHRIGVIYQIGGDVSPDDFPD